MTLKRLLDLVLSALGLILLGPLLFAVAVLIKLGSPGPVFFRQVRVGLHGEPFRIFKFRTMVVNARNSVARQRRLTTAGSPEPGSGSAASISMNSRSLSTY